jgi:hypothetical protein
MCVALTDGVHYDLLKEPLFVAVIDLAVVDFLVAVIVVPLAQFYIEETEMESSLLCKACFLYATADVICKVF